jgi:nitrogen fixation protein FixH
MNRSAEWTLNGRHVLAITLGFFAVVIGVNLTLAVLARSSWSGLVVESSYVASQKFNSDAEVARRQQALGWQERVRLGRQSIEVTVSDAHGRGLSGLTVQVLLQRPATSREDRTLVLNESVAGSYRLDTAIAPGMWIADITAQAADGRAVRTVHRLQPGEER